MTACTLGRELAPPQRMPDYYVTVVEYRGDVGILPDWYGDIARRTFGEDHVRREPVHLPEE